jgi:hypothetical protein
MDKVKLINLVIWLPFDIFSRQKLSSVGLPINFHKKHLIFPENTFLDGEIFNVFNTE